jgi:Rps23 Pro-64 3,4-dihydroxylase Tpa1-like proline 4-hydroxylase
MKLVYSIPGKLYYIQNFLDYPTYKKLHYDIFRSSLIKLRSTKKTWEKSLSFGYKKYVKNTCLDEKYKLLQKIKILLENNPFHKVKIENFKPSIHSMKDGTGINWHNDYGHIYGITYYINRRWNLKFGGEFLFKDKNANGFIPLVGNSIVIIKAPLDHKVTPVMKPLVPRKTIQIFINKENNNGKNS